MPKKNIRCEGWRRTGIFQMGGTGRWRQCENWGIAMLKFKDAETKTVKTLPACKQCWDELLDSGVKVITATPIPL